MEKNREPWLDPTILEEIETRRFSVHKRFWDELAPLRFLLDNSSLDKFASLMPGDKSPPQPPMPKQPLRLCKILVRYADELFQMEYTFYYDAPDAAVWSSSLAARVEQLVVDNVDRIGDLTFHATHDQMRTAMREGLLEIYGALIAPLTPDPVPQSPAVIVIPEASPKVQMAEQIMALFKEVGLVNESGLAVKDVATALGVRPKSVYRHIDGDAYPREGHLDAYEKFFSEALGRPITLKRQKRIIRTSRLGSKRP
jgi:hypothetical protein